MPIENHKIVVGDGIIGMTPNLDGLTIAVARDLVDFLSSADRIFNRVWTIGQLVHRVKSYIDDEKDFDVWLEYVGLNAFQAARFEAFWQTRENPHIQADSRSVREALELLAEIVKPMTVAIDGDGVHPVVDAEVLDPDTFERSVERITLPTPPPGQ